MHTLYGCREAVDLSIPVGHERPRVARGPHAACDRALGQRPSDPDERGSAGPVSGSIQRERLVSGSFVAALTAADPPIAVVGETEAEVRARHYPAVAKTTPLAYVPRAGAVHKTTGFVKFIASSIDERVLGVNVIGESAPEIIHEAAMAMHFKATLADFIDLIHVYPTMSETLKIGAQAFSRDVTKLSCCAE